MLQGQLTTANVTISTLTGQLNQAILDRDSAQSQVISLQAQVTSLQDNVNTLTTQLSDSISENSILQGQIDSLKNSITEAKQVTYKYLFRITKRYYNLTPSLF